MDQAVTGGEKARHAPHGGDLDGLVEGERGQDGRQAARQHGLTRAGRPQHEDVVSAGRRDLERALGVGVAANIPEVEMVRVVFRCPGPALRLLRRDVALAVQVLDGVVNGLEGNDGELAHHGGLDGVGGGDQEPRDTGAPAMKSHGQHTPGRADMAVQRKLAQDDRLLEATRFHQSRRREDPERHG